MEDDGAGPSWGLGLLMTDERAWGGLMVGDTERPDVATP